MRSFPKRLCKNKELKTCRAVMTPASKCNNILNAFSFLHVIESVHLYVLFSYCIFNQSDRILTHGSVMKIEH